jgi:hypothetical protein
VAVEVVTVSVADIELPLKQGRPSEDGLELGTRGVDGLARGDEQEPVGPEERYETRAALVAGSAGKQAPALKGEGDALVLGAVRGGLDRRAEGD